MRKESRITLLTSTHHTKIIKRYFPFQRARFWRGLCHVVNVILFRRGFRSMKTN